MEEGHGVAVQGPVEAPAAHPLDPLSADEIAAACAIVKESRRLEDDVRFPWVTLHEPPKDVAWGHRPGTEVDRRAEVAVCERTSGTVHDGRTLLYRASKRDCDVCPIRAKCCTTADARKIPRDLHEAPAISHGGR